MILMAKTALEFSDFLVPNRLKAPVLRQSHRPEKSIVTDRELVFIPLLALGQTCAFTLKKNK